MTVVASEGFTPLEVTNAYISHYADNGDLSHMKLQKLTYLTHAYWLQENDSRVVSADPEVWQYGPVFGGLYQNLKAHRNEPIMQPASEFFDFNDPPVPTDTGLISLIGRVWNKYGNKSGGQLSDLTHRPGSPWHTMAKKHGFRVPQGLTIPANLIRHHYRTEIPRLN